MSTNHYHLNINICAIPYMNFWTFIQAFMTNKIVFGDFNLEISHPVMLSFKNNENFINLVKGNTCFKGKGSCIGLILTNKKAFFQTYLFH